MEYRNFRDTGIKISLLGMGCMRLPATDDEKIDFEKTQEMLDLALRRGINYFDTAYLYYDGESERCVGRIMSRHPRGDYMLATKIPATKCGTKEEMLETFNEQLRRLQTDYIDFYLLHNLSDPTFEPFLQPHVLECALELKRQGKIRFLGFSSHGSLSMLERFADLHDWDFAQLQINYFDWSYQDAKSQYEILSKRSIPIMVMEPARGGRLANLSPESAGLLRSHDPNASYASWALRWAASLGGVQVVLSGMSSMAQLEDNLSTFDNFRAVNEEEREILKKAAEMLKAEALIPCTSCRYCVDVCPQNLDIPNLLRFSNEHTLSKVPFSLFPLLRVPEEKRAGACVACRECVSRCPQGIDIPEHLARLDDDFRKLPPPPPGLPI